MSDKPPLSLFFTLLDIVHTHTQHPAAAGAFVDLIVKESDNNVKLIVLDRFDVLRAKHEHVLDSFVLDILKVLSR